MTTATATPRSVASIMAAQRVAYDKNDWSIEGITAEEAQQRKVILEYAAYEQLTALEYAGFTLGEVLRAADELHTLNFAGRAW